MVVTTGAARSSSSTTGADSWQSGVPDLDTRRFRAALGALLLDDGAQGRLRISRSSAVLPPRLGAVMRGRLERGFGLHSNRNNPFARMLLARRPDDEVEVPPQNEAHLTRTRRRRGVARGGGPAGSVDGFTLSNILDGASDAYRAAALCRGEARREARCDRRAQEFPRSRPPRLLTNHADDDRAMLWGVVDVRPASTFERVQ